LITRLVVALLATVLLSSRPARAEGPVRIVLPGGVRLLVRHEPGGERVAFCVLVRAGAAEEEGLPGVGLLTARSLFGSNLNQSADAVQRYVYSAGGSLEVRWHPDCTSIECVTTREAFADAFYVVCQALKNAAFDAETVAAARRQVEAEASRAASDPFQAAYAGLRRLLHPDSAYGGPFGASEGSLRRLTPEAAQAYFRKWYTPGRTVVSVAGAIRPEEAEREARNQLIDYDRPEARPPRMPAEHRAAAGLLGRAAKSLPAKTTTVAAAFPAPGLADPDQPAFAVLTALVGGGKSSRLFQAAREQAGLGYALDAHAPPLAGPGHLVAYLEFDPALREGRTAGGANAQPSAEAAAERLVVESVRSVLWRPPDARELERARRFAIGTHVLGRQRARDRAFHGAWQELLGPGAENDDRLPDRLSVVTAEDVARAARRFLRCWAVCIVRPATARRAAGTRAEEGVRDP